MQRTISIWDRDIYLYLTNEIKFNKDMHGLKAFIYIPPISICNIKFMQIIQ